MPYTDIKEKFADVTAMTLSKGKRPEHDELRRIIHEATAFLDASIEDVKYVTRLYCINNGVTSIPPCKCCGNQTVPNKLNMARGFSKFCSLNCSRQSSNFSDELLSKLNDYDWMYEQRITLKKSWEDIGKENGISHFAVKKYAVALNIPEVNYNKTEPTTASILENKEALEELYATRSIYQIAEELDVSPSFVGVWLNNHGIKAKQSNAYPRKIIKVSRECQQVVDFIKSVYEGPVILNDRSTLGDGRELDILLPEKGIAIEYNGVFSHLYRPWETKESLIKGPKYHQSKAITCREKGIHLFMIWSDDWKSKQDIIKSMIRTKLGIAENKVYARKCSIITPEKSTKRVFLDKNHLQGADRSLHAYALEHEGELIAVMTFGRSRYNKKYQWELSRFAVAQGVSCPGAFSKLLNAFRKEHEGSIISYADFDHSHGKVYEKNGFAKIVENRPSYWYVKKNSEVMEHRFKYRKDQIASPSDTRTEWEIMQSLGYNKIFDCGTIAFGLE